MHINKISFNTNFGVRLTDDAIKLMKKNGATDFEISTLTCKEPNDAIIDVEKLRKDAYIHGKHARIHLGPNHKLTLQNADKLCEAYNIEKFFSVLNPEKKSPF